MWELRPNKIKKKLANGELTTVLMSPVAFSADMVEFVGQLGFDGIWIETEHGAIDFRDIPNLTRAADLYGMTSIVRVNYKEQGLIYRTFDVGAQGIIVPHVDTKQEAASVVEGAKFAPLGKRGNFVSRQGIGVDNYFEKANNETLVVVLIEDIVAINNLDEILSVENIDVFSVAPGDLAQSIGHLGNISHPEVQSTIDNAINKIVSHNKIAGTLVTGENVQKYVELGAKFLMTSFDTWLKDGAKSFLNKIKV
ncbi:MAG: HpcH/HpaI aldolase family protein [Dehalococcoidia bacterium]